uniref:Immunoglobulin V-set domain-containing protein n=1 Tax=Corvus moneduloides TaxID=1196302 RepID=A0A8C3E265_CORMO
MKVRSPKDITQLRVGQRLELECQTDKNSGAFWIHQDKSGTLHFIVFISSVSRTTFSRDQRTSPRFEASKHNSIYLLVVKSFTPQDEGNYFCMMNFNQMLFFSPGQPAFLPVTTTVAPTTRGPIPKRGITEDSNPKTPDPGNLNGGRERGRAGLCSTNTKGDPAGILGLGGREKIHRASLSQMQGLNSSISSNLIKAKDDVKSTSMSHAWAHQEQGREGRALGAGAAFSLSRRRENFCPHILPQVPRRMTTPELAVTPAMSTWWTFPPLYSCRQKNAGRSGFLLSHLHLGPLGRCLPPAPHRPGDHHRAVSK